MDSIDLKLASTEVELIEIKKSKSTGGNTTYFNKTDKSYLDDLLDFDECN